MMTVLKIEMLVLWTRVSLSPLLLQNDEEISESIQSLNIKQREIFDYVSTWAKEKMKQKSSIKSKAVKPFNLYISDLGGVKKSHLIKTMYQ